MFLFQQIHALKHNNNNNNSNNSSNNNGSQSARGHVGPDGHGVTAISTSAPSDGQLSYRTPIGTTMTTTTTTTVSQSPRGYVITRSPVLSPTPGTPTRPVLDGPSMGMAAGMGQPTHIGMPAIHMAPVHMTTGIAVMNRGLTPMMSCHPVGVFQSPLYEPHASSSSATAAASAAADDSVRHKSEREKDQLAREKEQQAEDGLYMQCTAINLANVALFSCRSQKVSIDDFKLLKVLGKGSYGKVMLVEHKLDKTIYAMKMLRKDNIVKRNQVEHTKTERHVLENINHPFIVHLHFAFQTPKKLYFVMEYCPGGELFFHLSRAGRFTESRSRFYAAQIVLALEHLHKLGVIYRDLKPENVLVDCEGYLRLTDFGLSKEGITDNSSAKSLCGTPEYLAPEILNQSGHGKAVDWWSLGALIYEMLTGLPPFYTRDREKLFQNIRYAELRYPSFVKPQAKSLMMGLFQRDPEKRLGAGPNDAQDIMAHPFFAPVDWPNLLGKRLKPPFQPTIQSSTDVSNFEKDFTVMPIINSEVPESLLGAAAAKKDDMFAGFTYDPREHEGIGEMAGMAGIQENM